MRLIDADKLYDKWSPDGGRVFPADYFLFTIEVAPTIEAVPIDFIRDFMTTVNMEKHLALDMLLDAWQEYLWNEEDYQI